ncbi:MAG: hypothetical protein A3A65_01305 [Candidatus Chisholmbacteria bacterium RIFCSPLOWO2_01_FULL_49_14]|uniref:Uncharacterized protein n=1 Tax=Candidatus Chisholmbacteria bacterium RIFCSPLOWO2_01_FULL_49_14 TaxID=1797593 RepID=A0A1G1VZH6_9BACT|nr:MAG: hypothetical protein A3A65_01305 [Candidatus Chisholmbacteria bacterium RIFCSPLOWO2_01_FULL_49_14]
MNNHQFKELYRFYQSVLLKTFEEEIKERGWKITERIYRSNFSRDLASLKLRVKYIGQKKEGCVTFRHAWMEVLFIDRDEIPLCLDLRILDMNFGLAKTTRIAVERAEIMDACFKNDQERLHALGRIVDRLRSTKPIKKGSKKEKVELHYEKGVEQSDVGAIISRKDK